MPVGVQADSNRTERAGGGPAPYLTTAERARTVRGGSCCGHSTGTQGQARSIVEGRGAHFVLAEVPRHAPAGAAALPEPRVLTSRQRSKRLCAWDTRQRGKGRETAGRPLHMWHAIGAVRNEGTRMRLSGTPSTHQSTMDHSSSSLFWIGVPVRPARVFQAHRSAQASKHQLNRISPGAAAAGPKRTTQSRPFAATVISAFLSLSLWHLAASLCGPRWCACQRGRQEGGRAGRQRAV